MTSHRIAIMPQSLCCQPKIVHPDLLMKNSRKYADQDERNDLTSHFISFHLHLHLTKTQAPPDSLHSKSGETHDMHISNCK